eukprot:1152148-Pelagomonas_calceolata.AAC.5
MQQRSGSRHVDKTHREKELGTAAVTAGNALPAYAQTWTCSKGQNQFNKSWASAWKTVDPNSCQCLYKCVYVPCE